MCRCWHSGDHDGTSCGTKTAVPLLSGLLEGATVPNAISSPAQNTATIRVPVIILHTRPSSSPVGLACAMVQLDHPEAGAARSSHCLRHCPRGGSCRRPCGGQGSLSAAASCHGSAGGGNRQGHGRALGHSPPAGGHGWRSRSSPASSRGQLPVQEEVGRDAAGSFGLAHVVESLFGGAPLADVLGAVVGGSGNVEDFRRHVLGAGLVGVVQALRVLGDAAGHLRRGHAGDLEAALLLGRHLGHVSAAGRGSGSRGAASAAPAGGGAGCHGVPAGPPALPRILRRLPALRRARPRRSRSGAARGAAAPLLLFLPQQ